jgi:hypothetical protein
LKKTKELCRSGSENSKKTDEEKAKNTVERHERPPLPQAGHLDFSFLALNEKKEKKRQNKTHKYKPP